MRDLLGVFVLLVGMSLGQESQKESTQPAFRVQTDLVAIPFEVRRGSRPVSDLEPSDVVLLEDGAIISPSTQPNARPVNAENGRAPASLTALSYSSARVPRAGEYALCPETLTETQTRERRRRTRTQADANVSGSWTKRTGRTSLDGRPVSLNLRVGGSIPPRRLPAIVLTAILTAIPNRVVESLRSVAL